jgi:hypothetical protein
MISREMADVMTMMMMKMIILEEVQQVINHPSSILTISLETKAKSTNIREIHPMVPNLISMIMKASLITLDHHSRGHLIRMAAANILANMTRMSLPLDHQVRWLALMATFLVHANTRRKL